jgi:beta-lactamase regulating signal transducer with metallopeptidase domain
MDAMLLLKASLLWAIALSVAWLLRRAPAAARHRLWTLAFVALLALPVLVVALPGLDVPVPARWRPRAATSALTPPFFPSGSEDGRRPREATRDASRMDETTAHGPRVLGPRRSDVDNAGALATGPARLLAVWMLGAIAATAALLLSLLRARRLARDAEDLDDPDWRTAADALGSRLGLRRPARLLVSSAVATPMAGGISRPVIFLPTSARAWDAEQRDVVLAHEIAHLAGSDPLRHVTARLAIALYWFHPLAWTAARQSTVSREQACDETVLALGLRPSTYARVLLEMAESLRPSIASVGALPMVEPSLLERRLMAILNAHARPATRRRSLALAIGAVLITLSVAAVRPAAVPPAHSAASGTPAIAGPTVDRATEPVTTPAEVSVEPTVAEPPAIADAQRALDRDSACWWDPSGNATFSGNISMSDVSGRTVIHEQVGTRGTDRIIQKSFDDVRLCMLAEGAGDPNTSARPSQWLDRSPRVVMESRRGRAVQRLEIAAARTSWQVDGSERPFDAAAQQWRDRMLAVLDTTWDLSTLRGQVSSLRGEISSIRGQESSLRGEISSLEGQVSSMRGHASSVQGEESSLRGRISSIQGHVSSLRGAISSERGAISSLTASRYGLEETDRARIATRIAQHDAEIARIEREIRDYDAEGQIAAVERQIRMLDAAGKIAAIEAEVRGFDLQGRIAAVDRRIADLDVAGKVAAIERQIQSLDADRRSQQLEAQREKELKQLEAALAAIR